MRNARTLPKTPKRIIISHVYSSENKGDAALTSVLIQDLRREFPKADITILTLDMASPGGYFEGVPETPSFMFFALNRYKNPLAKLIYTSYMFSATLAWALWLHRTGKHLYLPTHMRKVADMYEMADLVVPVGGGYLRSRSGILNRLNVPLLLHPLLFATLLGKPTVLYSQSVGPFQNQFEKSLVAFVLKRMSLILLREDTSQALLANLGVTRNVMRAVDSGFLLTSSGKLDLRKKYHIAQGKSLVGVTVRSWLDDTAQAAYERAVAEALDAYIEAYDAHIVFIPQVTAAKGDDDRVASHRVYDRMLHRHAATVIDETPDHHHIKALYDNLDLLLGTRFHSVIFALTGYVPVLAIEYEHKTSGIMHDLGLDTWVIKIEDVAGGGLTEMLHKLHQEKTSYKSHLEKRLPTYLHKAQQTIALLRESYEIAVRDSL